MENLLTLAERYDVAAPRYTSYPTAASFSRGVGPTQLAAAIERTNEDAVPGPVELYIHIPFCHSLCYYCACNRTVTRNSARVRRYMDQLVREGEGLAPLLASGREVSKIHLGGGTPTYLPPAALGKLMQGLERTFPFAPASRLEGAVEVDPRTVTADDIGALRALGFTRLSFGVQDMDPQVQAAINRVQPFEMVADLTAAVRREGFRSLNFDLIYGLPHQTMERFDRTLDQVLELAPDRIALYGYAHLPERFRAQRLLRSQALPSGRTRLAILVHAIQRLSTAGYEYIGMDHFARPDDALAQGRRAQTLIRDFQGYEPGPHTDLIGLGVSAISSLGGMYAQNRKGLREWEAAVDAATITTERGYVLDPDDRLRRDVIEAIMCRDRVPFAEFEDRHDIDFRSYFADALPRLDALEADGLVRCADRELQITPRGRLFLRAIAMCFDAYLRRQTQPGAAPRYSRVV